MKEGKRFILTNYCSFGMLEQTIKKKEQTNIYNSQSHMRTGTMDGI